MTTSDPFDRIPDPDSSYAGTVLETSAEREQRAAEECGARHDDVTSITCHRPKGHRRDHEGVSTVTWEQDDRFCTTHGRAHWDDGDRTCRFTDDPAGTDQVAASPAAGEESTDD